MKVICSCYLFVDENRCDRQPAVCTGDGQMCNNGPMGTHFCSCKPGYAPRYDKDTNDLTLKSCEQSKVLKLMNFLNHFKIFLKTPQSLTLTLEA